MSSRRKLKLEFTEAIDSTNGNQPVTILRIVLNRQLNHLEADGLIAAVQSAVERANK